MPAFLFNAPSAGQQRLYLDESGTLGYGGEIFTMAMVLVRDLPKLEACTLKNRITQSEVKASQMKTAQKLALARTLLDENDIEVYLAKLDPIAAMVCERKLDKELLYDSMVAQALAFYLERGDLERGLPYRISMDMRGGLRESYEDMVAESVGNVLMHRPNPLVTSLDARFLDSKYSAGVQAADLFSNIYRTALTQTDSPCRSFLYKYQTDGLVHAGFTFGLVELADQMTQIAADLRARVELERAAGMEPDDGLSVVLVEEEAAEPSAAAESEAGAGVSRSARRRRSRAARRDREAAEKTLQEQSLSNAGTPADAAATAGFASEKPLEAAGAPEDAAAHAAKKPAETGEAFPAPVRMVKPAGKEAPAAGSQVSGAPAVEQAAAETRAAAADPAVRAAAPQVEKPPVLPFAPKGRMRTRTHRSRAATRTAAEAAGTPAAHGTPAGVPSAPNPVAADVPSTSLALEGRPQGEQRTPEVPAAEAPTAAAKVDVRPGRSARSRQAAQAASRQRKRLGTGAQRPALAAPQDTSAQAEPVQGGQSPAAETPNTPAQSPTQTLPLPATAVASTTAPGKELTVKPTPAGNRAAAEADVANSSPAAPSSSQGVSTAADEAASVSPESPAAPKKPAPRRRRKPAAKASGDTTPEPTAIAGTTTAADEAGASRGDGTQDQQDASGQTPKTPAKKKATRSAHKAEEAPAVSNSAAAPAGTSAEGTSAGNDKPAPHKRPTPRRRKTAAPAGDGAEPATPGGISAAAAPSEA